MRDKADVYAMWERGAKIFVCGSPSLAKAVGAAARGLVVERMEQKEREGGKKVEEEELKDWFLQQRGERFVTDVFA